VVLILGAGGVARSIGAALLRRGAMVTYSSRRDAEARGLAAELKCRAVAWEERYVGVYEIVINCTPLGMYPNINESAYHQSALRENMVILDTVYNPENTVLVREARYRDCRVATGVDMFVGQAEEQFRLFTDQVVPPKGLMADLVREEFSPAKVMLRQARLHSGDDSMAGPINP
jgi:3-dehydroquinate dehydratase/shikimate dehydrogenase